MAIRIRRADGRGRETRESLREVDGGAEADLRQVVPRSAVVRRCLARAGATLERPAGAGPHVQRDVDAVEVVSPLAILRRVRDQIAHAPEEAGRNVVEARYGVPAAARQSRIGWRGDAVLRKVGGGGELVVIHGESIEPAPRIGHFDRSARQNLLLDGGAERPVRRADAPAGQQRRIERVGQCRRSEGRIRDRPTHIAAAAPEILGGTVQQITVGLQVVVGVRPRTCDAARRKWANRARHPQCRIRVRPVVGDAHAFEVLAGVELECRPAVAEHVVCQAHSRRDVLVGIDSRRLGNDEGRR